MINSKYYPTRKKPFVPKVKKPNRNVLNRVKDLIVGITGFPSVSRLLSLETLILGDMLQVSVAHLLRIVSPMNPLRSASGRAS